MVWSDPPASLLAAVALVVDFDLVVRSPTNAVYLGNGGATADRLNNAERVHIKNPEPGEWCIDVQLFKNAGYVSFNIAEYWDDCVDC